MSFRSSVSLEHEIANSIRTLAMDAVQKANSGHPGLPMGCAELATYLWTDFMNYNPKNPDWAGRDRFVLSAGHGSMLLYSMLHLTGYDLSLEDLKEFRQLGSRTPGHPEKLDTEGVEVTTGPLGQGVGNAVGIALALKILENRFNRPGFPLFSNKVICLAGDGCMMEGVSEEASSLAGHLKLNNLILIYDMNGITLDDKWEVSCSDNQRERYESLGWDVVEIKDGNDSHEIRELFSKLKGPLKKPTFVMCRTIIGKGSPNKQGSHLSHGSPLGPDEVLLSKKNLGIPTDPPFYVPASVRSYFQENIKACVAKEEKWNDLFDKWKKAHPDLYELYQKMQKAQPSKELLKELQDLPMEEPLAGRKASQGCLQVIAKHLPHIIGGSADLSESDYTFLKAFEVIKRDDFSGRNIKYGIREFGMATIASGMSTTMLRPYIGTFFCFSDYMRNAIRLASLSRHPVIYQFTHDSIGLGEDGPTHQPVEHLAALRAMPNLLLFRPGDANEVKATWWFTLNYQKGPVAIVLSRQTMPMLREASKVPYTDGVMRGAYVLIGEDGSKPIDVTLIATGTELSLAVDVAKRLTSQFKKNVRVVSMPCMRLFEEESSDYKKKVLGGKLGKRVSIEAASSFGWDRYVGPEGIMIALDEFGRSAPLGAVMQYFGFTPDQIVEKILSHL